MGYILDGIFGSIGQRIGEFRRNWLNVGYTEYLIQKDEEAKSRDDQQISDLVGRIATISSRDGERLVDEGLILRDQIFELERNRIQLDLGKTVLGQSPKSDS